MGTCSQGSGMCWLWVVGAAFLPIPATDDLGDGGVWCLDPDGGIGVGPWFTKPAAAPHRWFVCGVGVVGPWNVGLVLLVYPEPMTLVGVPTLL